MTKKEFRRPIHHSQRTDWRAEADRSLAAHSDDRRLFEFAKAECERFEAFQAANSRCVLASALALCESPIERYLAVAMAFMEVPVFGSDFRVSGPMYVTLVGYFQTAFLARNPREGVEIYPQCAMEGYRLDFLIAAKFECSPDVHLVAVECDGHDFHDRTKEQARRDRERDRAMHLLGITVLRFTGSEIFEDAVGCAAQISEHLGAAEWRIRGKDE